MILIITAGVVALLGTLIGTRIFIGFLVRRGYGQFVRDDGPKTHGSKRGTPTMGGAVIVGSALVSALDDGVDALRTLTTELADGVRQAVRA